jgi:hypothetical protein
MSRAKMASQFSLREALMKALTVGCVALVFLFSSSFGCGSSSTVIDGAACPSPDAATTADSSSDADSSAQAEVAADTVAPAPDAAVDTTTADAAAPSDVADAASPLEVADAATHDGSASQPDGYELTDALSPAGTPSVEVALGFLSDLDAAIGTNSLGNRAIGTRIRVLGGFVGDDIFLDHIGRVSPPWGQAEKVGSPLVVTISGSSFFPDAPAQAPDPEFTAARLLYDAMAHGPHTGDAQTGTRDSPGGRIHCEVKAAEHEAACYFTDVLSARF